MHDRYDIMWWLGGAYISFKHLNESMSCLTVRTECHINFRQVTRVIIIPTIDSVQ